MSITYKARFREILFWYKNNSDMERAIVDIEDLNNEIWNEAIEAAANWLETADRNNTDDAKEIRKLKKDVTN